MEEMEHAEYLQRFGKYILTSKDIFDITNTNKVGELMNTSGL